MHGEFLEHTKMRETGGVWGFTGSTMTSLMFLWAMYNQFFPYHVRVLIEKYVYKLMGWVFYFCSHQVQRVHMSQEERSLQLHTQLLVLQVNGSCK
ncbi:unnamed protein product [Brassica rapa]|uniref:Uncharacterized protein n=1 Tax=Brassica campestris TaxID=3711 RepID=A0A8D9DBV5_BRACM|nr:unnamed protein product [Brassica rapa]